MTHPEKEWIISSDGQAIYILWGPKGELRQAQRTRASHDRIYWLDKIREKERKGYVEHARYDSFRPGWVHTGAKAILKPRLQGRVPLPPDGTKGILREADLIHDGWQQMLRLALTDQNKLDHFEWSLPGTIPTNPKWQTFFDTYGEAVETLEKVVVLRLQEGFRVIGANTFADPLAYSTLAVWLRQESSAPWF